MNKYPFQLRPSEGKGIGVFARVDIEKGTKLDRFIPTDSCMRKNPRDKEMSDFYGVKSKEGYCVPKNWGRMSLWWYLNHSDDPNVDCADDLFETTRDIKEGEEVTIDYSKLDPDINNNDFHPLTHHN